MFISIACRRGWIVTCDGDSGLQLSRSKTYKESFLWAGVALFVFGIGILIWIWGYIDYLTRRDQILFIPIEHFLTDDIDADLSRLI